MVRRQATPGSCAQKALRKSEHKHSIPRRSIQPFARAASYRCGRTRAVPTAQHRMPKEGFCSKITIANTLQAVRRRLLLRQWRGGTCAGVRDRPTPPGPSIVRVICLPRYQLHQHPLKQSLELTPERNTLPWQDGRSNHCLGDRGETFEDQTHTCALPKRGEFRHRPIPLGHAFGRSLGRLRAL